MATDRQKAQHRLDAAKGDRQRLEYQKSSLNRGSKLYATRVQGIDMQIVEADKEIDAARAALHGITRAENEGH